MFLVISEYGAEENEGSFVACSLRVATLGCRQDPVPSSVSYSDDTSSLSNACEEVV